MNKRTTIALNYTNTIKGFTYGLLPDLKPCTEFA